MRLVYPVDKDTVTQAFGEDNSNHPVRKDFYNLFDNRHPGVDFGVKVGTVVRAAGAGVVVRKENHKGMGNVVGVRNGNIVMLYAHLKKIKVDLGQVLDEGVVIGLSGETGNACGVPHLHFEIRDITKGSLKEMVFDPPFEGDVPQWKEEFEYVVNNKNAKKTWKLLAELFFGDEKSWLKLKKRNTDLDYEEKEVINDGSIVLVPNYK